MQICVVNSLEVHVLNACLRGVLQQWYGYGHTAHRVANVAVPHSRLKSVGSPADGGLAVT